jgi:hypothetical protein
MNFRFSFSLFLAVPVCFILTSNIRQETYEVIFRCLKKLGYKKGVDLKPTTVVCDFERAFMNAVQTKVSDFFLIYFITFNNVYSSIFTRLS